MPARLAPPAGGLIAGLLLLLLAGAPLPVQAQRTVLRPERYLQVGPGALPGFGAMAAYVRPHGFYSVSVALYMHGTPSFAGGEATLETGLGFGGDVRPLEVLRAIGNAGSSPYEVDLGVRVGPNLFFGSEESRADKNQRFNLFIDPYVRVTTDFGGSRIWFAELGPQRPFIRGGLWFHL